MRSTQTSVTTTATLLVASSTVNRNIVIHSASTTDVYLGASTVSTSTGFLLEKNDGPLTVTVPAGETLHGIVSTGTETVTVLLPNS